MEIKYSSHAVERMELRNISHSEIELLKEKPDGEILQTRDKKILFKKIKGRKDNMIAVVIIQNPLWMEVITVMNYFEVKI